MTMEEDLERQIRNLKKCGDELISKLNGMTSYYNDGSYKQSKIYQIAGRNDYTSTISFRGGSESEKEYGGEMTVSFYYTLEERKKLEENNYILDDEPFVKVNELLGECDTDTTKQLLKKGININDIEEILVFTATKECNTFNSKDQREPHILQIQVEASADYIPSFYGFYKKMKKGNVAITPEENSKYLAYKIIFEQNALTEGERSKIFDENNSIKSQSVAYHYLLYKKHTGALRESEKNALKDIKLARIGEKFEKADRELKNMGLSLAKLAKNYPKKALFLLNKIFTFHEIRYNITGKHLLYCSFDSFLHIYLRHVEEMEVKKQFADRDKFQLKEENVMDVMRIVMHALNDEYQEYKERNPQGRFCRSGGQAYYLNGDYYNVDVNEDGSISTFYKSGVDRG